LILVAAYLVFEVWMWKRKDWQWAQGKNNHAGALGIRLVAILRQLLFWKLSQDRGTNVRSQGGFQPHGLLWHPLAGVMAVFAVLLLA